MLFRQRFIVKRLTDFNSAFFASKKKNLLEQMGEDPNKVAQKKGPLKKVIDAETLEYLQNKLKQAKSAVIIDKEHYRIDVGLLLSRDPIFLQMEDGEMNGLRFRNKYAKKYNLMMPIPKEVTEFTEKVATPTPALEDLPTHEVMYPDGTRLTYSGNSKIPANVDISITDRSSIQYAPTYRTYLMVKQKGSEQWAFPTSYMPDKTTFRDSKVGFFNTLSNKKWEAMFTNNIPVTFTKRALTETEKNDPLNKKAVGIKTFYFNGYHQSGIVSVNPELYDEFAWVSRLELNKFLDKTRYDEIVNSLFIV